MPRRARRRFAAYTHQNSDPTPRGKRPASSLREPWYPPHTFRARGLPAWQDHAHRVRKGSISGYTRNRHSPGCPGEFFLTFSRRVQIRRGPLQAYRLSRLKGPLGTLPEHPDFELFRTFRQISRNSRAARHLPCAVTKLIDFDMRATRGPNPSRSAPGNFLALC